MFAGSGSATPLMPQKTLPGRDALRASDRKANCASASRSLVCSFSRSSNGARDLPLISRSDLAAHHPGLDLSGRSYAAVGSADQCRVLALPFLQRPAVPAVGQSC